MAHLSTIGIATDLGEERIARIREQFPDLTLKIATTPEEMSTSFTDIDAYVGSAQQIRHLNITDSLRWIQITNAGANAAPLADLAARGVILTNGSGMQAPNLAEHILALMFAFARNLPALMRQQREHRWAREGTRFELHEQTLCVVGLGDIGLELAWRAHGLGMRVTGVRRRDLPAPDHVSVVARLDAMDDVLAGADHVAICLPLTGNTRHLFDAQRLATMKAGAYIYNVGRGEIIDQDALIDALRRGHLGGAGLDVVTPEPLPADSPLWDMPNVIITSHTGGTPPRRERFLSLLLDNIARYRADEPLRNVVDLHEGY